MSEQTGSRTRRDRPTTLIWIDSREAILMRWRAGTVRITRLESEVPPKRRSTEHVEHDPGLRPGGGGGLAATGEPHRLEHLNQYLKRVADRVQPDDRLELIGPGMVHERLASRIAERDAERHHPREIHAAKAGHLTEAQLRARLRELVGVPPPRQRPGPASRQVPR